MPTSKLYRGAKIIKTKNDKKNERAEPPMGELEEQCRKKVYMTSIQDEKLRANAYKYMDMYAEM